MNKKTIIYILGGVAVLGIGYYFWNKSKNTKNEKVDLESKDNAEKVDSDTSSKNDTSTEGKTIDGKSIPILIKPNRELKRPNREVLLKSPLIVPESVPAPTKLTPQQLESKLSACGKKPLSNQFITLWNNCRNNTIAKLKREGLVGFDGSYFFEGSNDFYSGFDSNFDINI